MPPISYARHQFPPVVIRQAVWLYLRFTLGYRDVEELLAERGLEVSYETVRCWVVKFGPAIARRLRRLRPKPTSRWHLDEMVVKIAGERMYLWRAVDDEGEVLDMLVQRRRDKEAALSSKRTMLRAVLGCVVGGLMGHARSAGGSVPEEDARRDPWTDRGVRGADCAGEARFCAPRRDHAAVH
jgi:hypothetical protein